MRAGPLLGLARGLRTRSGAGCQASGTEALRWSELRFRPLCGAKYSSQGGEFPVTAPPPQCWEIDASSIRPSGGAC